MEHRQSTYRLGELFCGPGGIAVGAKWATDANAEIGQTIEHAWATDYDKDTCATFRRNILPKFPARVVCKDIRKLDLRALRDISEVDALAFGFPCNDFSVVGEQKGTEGTFGPLYTYCVEAVKLFRPLWFLAENVGGLRNANDGQALQRILESFHKAGYELVPHLYKLEQYGVPQARHRIMIVGVRSDLEVAFRVPSPEPYRGCDISCQSAIEDPPIAPNAPNHDFTKQSSTVVARLKYIKPGENAFTADLPSHLQLNVRGARISQIYRRLEPDKPAYTITGSGGGGTHVYHWSEHRALTNRERARLQSFPDSFVFEGSKESVRKQVGMAVPPKAAAVVLDAVLKTMGRKDYPSIEPNIPWLTRAMSA